MSSELSWQATPNSGSCDADFKVEFQNLGKQSLDTTKIHYEGWLAELQDPAGEKPTFIDVEGLQRPEKKFFDSEVTQGTLVGHFAPGSSVHDTVSWRFKKSPTSFVYFSATIEGTVRHGYIFTKSEFFRLNAASWNVVCGDIKTAAPAK